MDVYSLVNHLKKCPEDFLLKIETKAGEMSLTEILIRDTYRRVNGNFNIPDSNLPAVIFLEDLDENYLQAIRIAYWFFSYEAFKEKKNLIDKISLFLFQ